MRSVVALAVVTGCAFHSPTQSGDASSDAPVIGAIDAPVIDGRVDGPRPPPDASPPPPDAGFSAALCPAGYTNTTVSASTSRYRVIGTQAGFALQHADCSDDHAGWTHLVVYNSVTEATQIGAVVGTNYYVGSVQAPDQATPGAGWFAITGAPMIAGLWQPIQPNDNAGVENNDQNVAAADGTGRLNDVGQPLDYLAVCECDGLPVNPTVAGYIP